MISYRAEIWCDGVGGRTCISGYGEGIPHDDVSALPVMARNRRAILQGRGWTQIESRDYCPGCTEIMKRKAKIAGAAK